MDGSCVGPAATRSPLSLCVIRATLADPHVSGRRYQQPLVPQSLEFDATFEIGVGFAPVDDEYGDTLPIAPFFSAYAKRMS
mgnify:CR=1 FL=1